MPYSIFFTQSGDAIHGTYEQWSLGRAVSHGCVRLSRKNAATLWEPFPADISGYGWNIR
jgi:lipoprotein-anchoring transpeptidase ErfK/SrfK